jgi:hypothetical protein
MKKPAPDNPLVLDERKASGKKRIQRGVRLLQHLIELADQGESVGVSYSQFVCLLYGVSRYEQVIARGYARADTPFVMRIAKQVTDANGGRQPVTRYGVTIKVGMDSFLWHKARPHERPQVSFAYTPYSESEWKVVFPDGARRLLGVEEYRAVKL